MSERGGSRSGYSQRGWYDQERDEGRFAAEDDYGSRATEGEWDEDEDEDEYDEDDEDEEERWEASGEGDEHDEDEYDEDERDEDDEDDFEDQRRYGRESTARYPAYR